MPTPERPPRRAAALRYDKEDRTGAPKVVAAGRGEIAEKILAAARDAGVPIREDRALAEALAALEVGTEIPPQLYEAVAQALVWALRLDRLSHALGAAPETRP
jgi:flagellar biosynthesis protein